MLLSARVRVAPIESCPVMVVSESAVVPRLESPLSKTAVVAEAESAEPDIAERSAAVFGYTAAEWLGERPAAFVLT